MQQFEVILYNPSYKSLWNTFLLASNQDTFLFDRNFMDYHNDRYEDFSLLVYKNDQLIALLPANRENDSLYSHNGLTYGGLIYDKQLKISDAIFVLKAVLEFLHTQKITYLTLKELPSIYLQNPTNNILPYLLFKLKAQLIKTDIQSVIDNNHKSYSNSRKEGYKRGLKHNLKVSESDSFELFWNKTLIPNLEKKHSIKPVHSLEEITFLKSNFKDKIRQFNVFHNETIVGGTTIFETENVVHFQYISGNSDKNKLGSLDFLHIHLLDKVFKDKLYFDFGTSNINNGENINEGLQFWKEGFGARSITQSFFKVETENHILLNNVFV